MPGAGGDGYGGKGKSAKNNKIYGYSRTLAITRQLARKSP